MFRRKTNYGKSQETLFQILSNISCLQEEARRSVSGMQVHRREGKGENGNSDGEEKKIVGDGREGKIVNTSRCKEKGERSSRAGAQKCPFPPSPSHTKKSPPRGKGGKCGTGKECHFHCCCPAKKIYFHIFCSTLRENDVSLSPVTFRVAEFLSRWEPDD